MSEDMNQKIKQIADMLGQENMPENVKGLLSLLASQSSQPKTSEKSQEPAEPMKKEAPPDPVHQKPQEENKTIKSDLDENIDMVRKLKKVMDNLNYNNDPRIHLLTSIKPFLNQNRQTKIGNCIRLLHMSSLARYINENDKENV